MWPKRKIQLVASSTAVGLEGVRAVLKEIGLEFCEIEPEKGDSFHGLSEVKNWLDKPLDWRNEELGPVTELVYWPEVSEEDVWRTRALAQGIKQQSIQSFLHSLYEYEFILWVPESTVLIEGCPLLGYILEQAGFEPSILWPTVEGEWRCKRKQGIHWVLPDFWLKGLVDASSLGRGVKQVNEKSIWVVREKEIDFYRVPDGQKFVGRLPRWPKAMDEQTACRDIAKSLDLGVSWLDITLALSFLWMNIISKDNLRWNINDFGWNGGKSGEKLSTASTDHVEDRWSC